MNLGVEEQAQRRKKDKKSRRSSRKKKDSPTEPKSQQPIQPSHRKIFQQKIMKVEQRKIGLIIGQNGKHIKELYKHSHCDVILPKQRRKKDDFDTTADYNYYYVYDSYNNTEQTNLYPNNSENKNTENIGDKNDKNKEEKEQEDIDDPKRLVEIKLRGTPEEIRDAELEINFMMKHGRLMLENERTIDAYDNKQSDEIAEDLRVPSKICGMLIGNRGQRVKELMEDTGAEIWVDWDKESHIEAGVSTVHLKGPKYCVENAKFEIKRIQKLFEKGSNNFRFEIPSYCSKNLFGENGSNLKMLQKQYGVTINVKNYKYERRRIRIGDEEQRIQRTCMIILIGEEEDQIACKKGIDRLVGMFIKCQECNNLKPDDDGHVDKHSNIWYCQDCWDEFNGVKKDDQEKESGNNKYGGSNNYNQYQHGSNHGQNKNKW